MTGICSMTVEEDSLDHLTDNSDVVVNVPNTTIDVNHKKCHIYSVTPFLVSI